MAYVASANGEPKGPIDYISFNIMSYLLSQLSAPIPHYKTSNIPINYQNLFTNNTKPLKYQNNPSISNLVSNYSIPRSTTISEFENKLLNYTTIQPKTTSIFQYHR